MLLLLLILLCVSSNEWKIWSRIKRKKKKKSQRFSPLIVLEAFFAQFYSTRIFTYPVFVFYLLILLFHGQRRIYTWRKCKSFSRLKATENIKCKIINKSSKAEFSFEKKSKISHNETLFCIWMVVQTIYESQTENTWRGRKSFAICR